MAIPLNIVKEENRLTKEIREIFKTFEGHIKTIPIGLNNQAKALFALRKDIYEDLNQLQHQALIITAAKYLKIEFPQITRWEWHPKQTSKPDEADLTGFNLKRVIISAEVTTSIKPDGSIDTRMRNTLNSLNTKKGKRFYFVQTGEMFKRAEHKIKVNEWKITPQLLNGRT